MISHVTDHQAISTFERILSSDPGAFLEGSVVYSVTQAELLQFVAQMAPKQARDAVDTLTRRLKEGREGVDEYKAVSNKAIMALEQELAEVLKASGLWKAKAELLKSYIEKNRHYRDHLEDVYLAFSRFLHDVDSLNDSGLPALTRGVLATMQAEMRDLMRKTHQAIEYPMPLIQ